MLKIKETMNKTMTWGGYWKFCGIVYAIAMVIYAASIIGMFHDEISAWLTEKVSRIQNRFKKEDYIQEEP